MESVILTGLRNQIVEVEPIPEERFGFKSDFSTEYQLLQITEAIEDGLGYIYIGALINYGGRGGGGKGISAARLS